MFTQVPLQQYTSAAAARVLPFHTVAARETRAHTSSTNMRTSSICCPLCIQNPDLGRYFPPSTCSARAAPPCFQKRWPMVSHEFCHTARARPPRARGPCNMARQLVTQHRTALLGHFEPRCLLGYQDLAHAVCD